MIRWSYYYYYYHYYYYGCYHYSHFAVKAHDGMWRLGGSGVGKSAGSVTGCIRSYAGRQRSKYS